MQNGFFGAAARRTLAGAASLLSLGILLATPAVAQEAPGGSTAPGGATARTDAEAHDRDRSAEEIVVTGTRVARSGFTAPTPTTVIGADLFQDRAATTVGEVLTQLPSFRATTSPTTSTVFGNSAYYADLRGLGPARTLVLVDGRRFVPTSATGQVDLNLIPEILIQRTEVVTGGASAQWGSDAVAGVVNILFKNDVQGIEAEAQKGISQEGDDANTKLGLIAGSSFGGGRGHIEVAGEYSQNQGTDSLYSRDWFHERHYVINAGYRTNGLPAFIWGNNVEHQSMTGGGIITGARVGNGALVTNTPLYGTAFGAGGVPYAFQFGTSVANAQEMFGTSNYGFGPFMNSYMKLPSRQYLGYAHADYELTDAVKLFVQGNYSDSLGKFYGQPTKNQGFGAVNSSAQTPLTIYRDNVFLPASVAALMDQGGFTSLQMGRVNQDIGGVYGTRRSKTYEIVGGLKGDLGGSWSWDGSVQYGRDDYTEITHAQRIEANWNRAIDAVRDPATGQATCRALLSADAATRTAAAGCVPFNLFGTDTASPAALNYVRGTSELDQHTTQFVSAVNLRGEPFSTWAGPVSIAVGAEYRRETLDATSDPLSQRRAFGSRNPQPISGQFHVKEVYGETVIPLLRDSAIAKSIDFNGAVRYTDYSTSGGVTTWKGGVTWDLNRSLRLRGTYSRDIRAPNLTELFTPASSTIAILIDPFRNEQAVPTVYNTGSLNLKPEKGKTLTAGAVLQPTFIPRLQLSVDYYKIRIDGLIATTTPATIVQRCYQGAQEFCGLITRGAAPAGQALGTISQITSPYLNLNRFDTWGLDFELSYRLPLDGVSLPGTFGFHGLATYVGEYRLTDTAGSIDRSGQNINFSGTGVDNFLATAILSYDVGRFSVASTLRYVNGGAIDKGAVAGTATSNNINHVDGAIYNDLNLEYTVGERAGRHATLFLYVSNLFDKDPPFPINEGLYYDVIGRAFRAGIRTKF